MNGKGSKPRPVDLRTYESNFDNIFPRKIIEKKTVHQWAEQLGDKVLDYDGFGDVKVEEPITREKYDWGIIRCTLATLPERFRPKE